VWSISKKQFISRSVWRNTERETDYQRTYSIAEDDHSSSSLPSDHHPNHHRGWKGVRPLMSNNTFWNRMNRARTLKTLRNLITDSRRMFTLRCRSTIPRDPSDSAAVRRYAKMKSRLTVPGTFIERVATNPTENSSPKARRFRETIFNPSVVVGGGVVRVLARWPANGSRSRQAFSNRVQLIERHNNIISWSTDLLFVYSSNKMELLRPFFTFLKYIKEASETIFYNFKIYQGGFWVNFLHFKIHQRSFWTMLSYTIL
jgi:hypothetical protein